MFGFFNKNPKNEGKEALKELRKEKRRISSVNSRIRKKMKRTERERHNLQFMAEKNSQNGNGEEAVLKAYQAELKDRQIAELRNRQHELVRYDGRLEILITGLETELMKGDLKVGPIVNEDLIERIEKYVDFKNDITETDDSVDFEYLESTLDGLGEPELPDTTYDAKKMEVDGLTGYTPEFRNWADKLRSDLVEVDVDPSYKG